MRQLRGRIRILDMSSSANAVAQRPALRVYLERYERDPSRQDLGCQDALAGLATAARRIAQIEERTGRRHPSLIT